MNPYLIIGDGRVATHFRHYFDLLDIPYLVWTRKTKSPLETFVRNSERHLLLIKDSAIENFVLQNPILRNWKTIHFSGALTIPEISSAHPLMTFSKVLYDLETYKRIPFILAENSRDFAELLPGLPNSNYRIPEKSKPLYHAYCVITGNFTQFLWENGFDFFAKDLNIPKEALRPYLSQIFLNLLDSENKESVTTGPLARGDTNTMIKNVNSLSGKPEQGLYYAFVNYALAKGKSLGGNYEHPKF